MRVLAAGLFVATLLGALYPPLERSASELTRVINIQNVWQRLSKHYKVNSHGRSDIDEKQPNLKDIPENHAYKKTVTIDAGRDALRARFDLYINKNEPLYDLLQKTVARPRDEWIENVEWEESTDKVVADIFGLVSAEGQTLLIAQSSLEVEEMSSTAHVQLVSEELQYDDILQGKKRAHIAIEVYTGNIRLPLDVSEIVVNTDGVRILPISAMPRSQYLKRTHFDEIQKLEGKFFRFDIAFPPREQSSSGSVPLASILNRLNEGYMPVLGPLLLGLLYSLPFLLFIRLKRHANIVKIQSFACYFDLAYLILILYLGQAILRSISDLTWYGPLWVTGGSLDSDLFGQPLTGIGPLIILFPFFIWPGIVKLWEQQMANSPCPVITNIVSEPRPWIVRGIAAATVAMWISTAFFILRSGGIFNAFFKVFTSLDQAGTVSHSIKIGAALPLALAALLAACLWLSYEIYGRAAAVFRALVLTLALLFLLVLDTVTFRYGLRTAFVVILALPFTFAFMRITYPVTASLPFEHRWANFGLLTRIVCVLGAFLLIFLLVRRDEEYQNITSSSLVASITWALSRTWIFILLLMLLRILKHSSDSTGKGPLPKSALDTGIVLALAFFFLPAPQWLYLPIVFLMGYALLRRWALVPRQLTESSSNIEHLQQSVREKIGLNDAVRGLKMLKKELMGKLSKGEIDYRAYTDRVNAMEDTVEEKRHNWLFNTQQKGGEALTVGPDLTPWERAKTGALYGLVFGLPWIVIFLSNLQKTTVPYINAELLSVITSSFLAIAQWPLQGFFFGYFYPYLRGSDGVQKGVYLFLTIFMPTFVATVLMKSMTGDVWTTFSLWGLQLFIQCMLLGLVSGDYETLRRAGLSWRHLIDVHNLGSLVAWGSSVIVALGAAIITLLTSGAVGLISSGLKALIPELQPISK